MWKIDPQTVQRILDTADIVEVVSDFVSLKRRGANYVGLCPFHADRTPSFYVSKAKGICKCFSCGKGGSAVGFIMEHEQLSYGEALRWLANKYGIEIKERELSAEEEQAQTERESMLAVNDFALGYFEDCMRSTDDGRDIGLAYFHERGISDKSIERFHLGYALEERDALLKAATAKGYSEKYLVDTGLCIRNERGSVYDRFRGRVIFPVFGLSGKVLAFGGRTLKKAKDIAKYVNSPESKIYHKSDVLYGLYQAKKAIVDRDSCILVEGYMDVISMHQAGIQNVVASSGTALTEGQIRLIRRFTQNVTVVYDSDAAGIKASLRGIDMLLAEGLNIKVLQLPDGEDPDSYSQSHSATEVEEYIKEHQTDFIRFKISILLPGTDGDPIGRSRVITDIVRSISVIPDSITRNVYIRECSRLLDVDEKVLALQVERQHQEHLIKGNTTVQQERATAPDAPGPGMPGPYRPDGNDSENVGYGHARTGCEGNQTDNQKIAGFMRPFEKRVLRYVLKYGMARLCDACDEDGNTTPITVIDYVIDELAADDMEFSNADFATAYTAARELADTTWEADRAAREAEAREAHAAALRAADDEIRAKADSTSAIAAMTEAARARADADYEAAVTGFANLYIERRLGSSADDTVRRLTADLVSERHQLSKIHTKYSTIETEEDRLPELVPRAIYEWKDAILDWRQRQLIAEIRQTGQNGDIEAVKALMARSLELQRLRSELARYMGERTLSPRK